MKRLALALSLAAAPAVSQEAVTYPFDGTFEDATFAVEQAIIGKGLVIDNVAHVGDMLNRTADDVGAQKELFVINADIFTFCSAVLSREVMEIDPMNIVFCPYGVFVVDSGSGVLVGHRDFPDGAMSKVEALLSEIAEEAVRN